MYKYLMDIRLILAGCHTMLSGTMYDIINLVLGNYSPSFNMAQSPVAHEAILHA